MRPLSVVIITYNEERNIGRCLASLMDIAEEVVVLDSFSTDGTEAIVRSHGARFEQHAFDGHIEQKNRAIGLASHPFVLSLDADEALDDVLRESIRKAKGSTGDGYTMNRLTNYCGSWIRHGGWYPDVKLRLWDSRKGRWTGTNPHDRYEMDKGARLGHLAGDLLHFSYYSLGDHLKQVDYFTDIMAKELHTRGRRASWTKLLLSPASKFFGDYFIRLGLLDGWHGFVIAIISAHAAFLKYAKLRELWRA
jgi:glycosyltransferase involved in cell wall biosynthesis